MIMAWYPWHDCIGTSLVIYFDARFQISGGLINQGQTPSRVQAFGHFLIFFLHLIKMDISVNSYYSEQ